MWTCCVACSAYGQGHLCVDVTQSCGLCQYRHVCLSACMCVCSCVCMYVVYVCTSVSMWMCKLCMYVPYLFVRVHVGVIGEVYRYVLYLCTCVSMCDWRSVYVCSMFVYARIYVWSANYVCILCIYLYACCLRDLPVAYMCFVFVYVCIFVWLAKWVYMFCIYIRAFLCVIWRMCSVPDGCWCHLFMCVMTMHVYFLYVWMCVCV